MGGRFTLSKADLADQCVFAFTSEAPDWPKILREIDSRINRAFHWVVAKSINGTAILSLIDDALAEHNLEPAKYKSKLLAMNPLLHAMAFQDRYRVTAQAEVALAYDWDTGEVRILGRDIGRDYILGPTEIGSTLDCFGTVQDPDLGFTVEVADWKTGPRARENVTPCVANRQIGGLAMMLSRVIQCDAIRQVLFFVAEDGFVTRDEHIADTIEDTNETEAWLQDIVARIRRNEGPRPGSHCTSKHCPLLGVCPETKKAIQTYELIAENKKGEVQPKLEEKLLPFVVVSPDMFMSDEHAAWAIHRAQAVAKLAGQIMDAAKAYADKKQGRRIPLTNGKFWGAGTIKTPHVETKGLKKFQDFVEAVAEEIGIPAAESMILAKISASDLREAAKSDKVYKQIVSNLRKAGFVRDEEKEEYRERNFAEPKKNTEGSES